MRARVMLGLLAVLAVMAGAGCNDDEAGPYLVAASIVETPTTSGGTTEAGEISALPAGVQARVFLGEGGDEAVPGSSPEPVDGAEVTVRWTGEDGVARSAALHYVTDRTVEGSYTGEGQYVATSWGTALVYVPGAEYVFEIRVGHRSFEARVVAPARSQATLTGPLTEAVTSYERSALPAPFTLDRTCEGACPPAFVDVYPGYVSFLAGEKLGFRSIPTCGTLPETNLPLTWTGWADGVLQTGTQVAVPSSPDCFARVVQLGPADELFFVGITAVVKGTVTPADRLSEKSVVYAGVSDAVTIRIPDPTAPWNQPAALTSETATP